MKVKSYAFCLASNKLWLSVSNALDRSINIVPPFLPLSRTCFRFTIIFSKGRYTYDVHENYLIFKIPISLVHLRPKFFHPLDLGRPILNELHKKSVVTLMSCLYEKILPLRRDVRWCISLCKSKWFIWEWINPNACEISLRGDDFSPCKQLLPGLSHLNRVVHLV